jgi:hypothetical protein
MHTRGNFIYDMYIVEHLFNLFESQGNIVYSKNHS